MQVNDLVRKCVAFIGLPNSRGEFAVEGTAFFMLSYVHQLAFGNLVTAAHVIDAFGDRPIHVRLNTKAGSSVVLETRADQWFRHHDKTVDIAVLPCDPGAGKTHDILYLAPEIHNLTDRAIEENGIGLGEEVFITGAFTKRIGESRNLPIVRTGSIAAMPEEPIWPSSPRRSAYLLEVRSLGGISGSPAFVHLDATRRSGRNTVIRAGGPREYLLGIVIGLHDVQHAPDMAPAESEPPTDALFNSGITVVLPVSLVMEAIETPILAEKRMAAISAKQKESGYRPASSGATKSEP